jgi:hypothetical protein
MATKKTTYSKPKQGHTHVLVRDIPNDLWDKVQAKRDRDMLPTRYIFVNALREYLQ